MRRGGHPASTRRIVCPSPFERFSEEFYALAYSIACRILRSAPEATSVARQVLLKAWHHSARGADVETLLTVLSVRASLDALERGVAGGETSNVYWIGHGKRSRIN